MIVVARVSRRRNPPISANGGLRCANQPCACGTEPPSRALRLFVIFEIWLDLAGELHRQWIAKAVLGLASGHPNPALAHAIFLDIGLLGAFEADADVARQRFLAEIGAARVVGEPVGRRVGRH